jgi:stage II sporulation protein D
MLPIRWTGFLRFPVFLLAAALVCFLFLTTVARAGTDRDFLFHKAQIFLASGKYLEALGLYQAVADNSPRPDDKADAMVMIGYIYSQFLDQPDMALKNYDYVAETYPRSAAAGDALFKKGMVLYQLRQYEAAHDAFSDYLGKYPDGRWRQSARAWQETTTNLASSGASGWPADGLWTFTGDTIVRVLLADKVKQLTLTADGSLVLSGVTSGKVFSPGIKTAEFSLSRQKITVNGKSWPNSEPLMVKSTGASLALNNTRYRGHFIVVADEDGLSAINHVDVEDYLYGVVPSEVPSSWPAQALMAQAVAARTYALYIKQRSPEKYFDVKATTESQVYGGLDAEKASARTAVDRTRSQVLTYNGRLIVAYFHANSGGYTECPEHVWGARFPYLKDQPDNYSKDTPGSTWECFLPFSEIRQRLRQFGVAAGNIKSIQLNSRTRSGRVREVTVVSDKGVRKIAGNHFRLALGGARLKSTCFQVAAGKDGIRFQGQGYGHGVGMSQWGAYQMALQGHDYKSILSHYYTGTRVAALSAPRQSENRKPLQFAKGNL